MRRRENTIKQAKGTHRPDKEKTGVQPDFIQDLAAPDALSPEARKQWDEIAPELGKDQLLTELDKRNLMAYCQEVARYWRLQADLEKEDEVLELTDKTGTVIVNYRINPKVELSDRALSNAYKLGLQFGLTPLARTKIGVPKKPKASPADNNISKLQALRGKVVQMKKAG